LKTKKIISLILSMLMLFGVMSNIAMAEDTMQENGESVTLDIYEKISDGVGTSETYITEKLVQLHNGDGVSYGVEWYIIAMLRAEKTIDVDILTAYYDSVKKEVQNWDTAVKPTDMERTALALTVMGKDITDVDGANLAEFIYNSDRLAEGSNELAYALITIDATGIEIPNTAVWNREEIIAELLKFQTADGGFGLSNNESTDVDITAICMQALAPYRDNKEVKEAIDKALMYLKDTISEEKNYSDNVNSTAQVLLALSMLDIDVTISENGFGNESDNLITALETYRNPNGSGYLYEDKVNPMATVQVMQAYDAYRKAHKEDISYWDFSTVGENYDDKTTDEDTDSDEKDVAPATIYVTIASEGSIVNDKNNSYVAQVPVTVTDRDDNGILTVDEALYATHEEYYEGGAEAGYNSYIGTYGLSLGMLWGKGTPGTTATAGYWINNASCWSLEDSVKEGDYITAFNYCDTTGWSDSYSCFDKNEVEVEKGDTATLTLNAVGYDSDWNIVFSPYCGAKVIFLGETVQEAMTTDENGQVIIRFNSSFSVGTYYLMAYKEDGTIVPSVCKINLFERRIPAGSGGGGGSGRREPKPEKEEKEEQGEEQNNETENTLFTETTFSDINKGDWYYDSVKYVYEKNLMQGTGKGFAPDTKMSRAMLITVLYRMTGEKSDIINTNFIDVPTGQWYSDSIAWAVSKGIVNGISDDEFAPARDVTREQMALVIYRFAKTQGYNVENEIDISGYTDVDDVSDWAIDAIKWANKTELINGTSENTLSPKTTATRAQVATILMRFCEKELIE